MGSICSSSSLLGLSEPLWSLEEVSESDEGYPEMGERSLGSGDSGKLLVVHTVIGLYAAGLRISGWGMTGRGRPLYMCGVKNTENKESKK